MQNTIFLPEDLQSILDSRAATIGITTSAFISAALKAAAVSVEKKGLPVPQPNITILSLSK